jgi:hypothetical protein
VTAAVLTDDEIDAICAGLCQSATKIRFLRRLGVRVDRKPNGRPLVARADWESRQAQNDRPADTGPAWGVH